MPKVKYVTSPNEIPAEQKYILVMMARNTGKRDILWALPLWLPVNSQKPLATFPS
jgi:hypothetical protein